MRVLLGILNNEQDVTQYLMGDEARRQSDIRITKEKERLAFERVWSDVHIVFGNQDGYFTTLFSGSTVKQTWNIIIYDDTNSVSFRGQLMPMFISLDEEQQTCTLDIFPVEKVFWDRTKTVYIPDMVPFLMSDYVLIQTFMAYLLPVSIYGDLFTSITIDPLYLGRYIRGGLAAASAIDKSITDYGRAINLDPSLTMYELLQAFEINYNAEIFIDDATNALTMAPRGKASSKAVTMLDDIVQDTAAIQVYPADDVKFDYIYCQSLFVPAPAAPTFTMFGTTIKNHVGTLMYCVTEFDSKGIETAPSTIVVVNPLRTSPDGVKYYLSPYGVTFAFPSTNQLASKRRLYRTVNGGNVFYLCQEFTTLTQFTWSDNVWDSGLNTAVQAPAQQPSSAGYLSYDEVKGQWNPPTPYPFLGAKIYSVNVALRFSTGRPGGRVSTIHAATPYEVWRFFGSESAILTAGVSYLQQQFFDFLRTKQRVLARVQKTDINLNDPFDYSKLSVPLSPHSLVVKRAIIDPILEESDVELITT